MSRYSRHLLWRMDLLFSRCVVTCESCFDCTIRVAGPVYILIAVGLICCIVYVFFETVLPHSYDLHSGWGIFHAALAVWIIVNIFFNYFYCVRTNPGNPPDVADIDIESLEDMNAEPEGGKGRGKLFSRWCKRCKKVKPPLTHHCHVCRKCILKMDHHCPWMHNCIGYYNYKYFFLFLFYMWVGCAYAASMSAIPLFGAQAEDDPASSIIFSFVLALAVCGALTFLLGWHVYLLCSGQTTIEFYGNRFKKIDAKKRGEVWVNEYDLGMYRNCTMTFGVSGKMWWLRMLMPWQSSPRNPDGRVIPYLLVRNSASPNSVAANSTGSKISAKDTGTASAVDLGGSSNATASFDPKEAKGIRKAMAAADNARVDMNSLDHHGGGGGGGGRWGSRNIDEEGAASMADTWHSSQHHDGNSSILSLSADPSSSSSIHGGGSVPLSILPTRGGVWSS